MRHLLVAVTTFLDDAGSSASGLHGFTIQYFTIMATIKLLLGVLCFAFSSSIGMLNRNLLIVRTAPNTVAAKRIAIVAAAEHEIGVREKTGNNDGEKVEAYLAYVHLKKGQPWCSAYVSWLFAQVGLAQPRSGWSPDLFPASRLARSALPGNVLGIYFAANHRIAHVGLITGVNGDWISSVEGNTNVNGSREGDGVYKKKRHVKTIYRMADWIIRKGALL